MRKVVIVRHEVADSNGLLTPESHDRAYIAGVRMQEIGISPDVVISSPRPRANQTATDHMTGAKKQVLIWGDIRLGDSLLGDNAYTAEEVTAIKELGATTKRPIETVVMTEPAYADKLTVRGIEGAQAVIDGLDMYSGILGVYSHGGFRIEVAIAALAQKPIDLEHAFLPGDIAVLTFDDNHFVTTVEYLGNLGKEETQAAAAIPPPPEK